MTELNLILIGKKIFFWEKLLWIESKKKNGTEHLNKRIEFRRSFRYEADIALLRARKGYYW